MKLLIVFPIFLFGVHGALYFDSYSGKQISDDEFKKTIKSNTTFWCTNEIEPCDPKEGRRLDGSCNNLQQPVRGAPHTPFLRLLPAEFDQGFEPRKPKCSTKWHPARYLRTRLLFEGQASHQQLTVLSINYLVFMVSEVITQQDTVNYVVWKPYCCQEKGKTDKECVPNEVPIDDPVHRFSGIRCMNMTRPISFQSVGCIKNDTQPERIISTTVFPELTNLYGTSEKDLKSKLRAMQGGLLKTEIDNGKIWPPAITNPARNICYNNQQPHETRCHDSANPGANSLGGVNMLLVWFWRLHNVIVTELAKINPCWDDEKLFSVGREINIAIVLQIFIYDLMPSMFGIDNTMKSGLTSPSFAFRDFYNPQVPPQQTIEYSYILRYFHTMQNGPSKMYDNKGNYLKQIPSVNLTLRTGFFALDDHMEGLTQGTFRQGCGATDYAVEPDLTGIGLTQRQRSLDILTNDLAKSRYFGLPSYIKYREFCTGQKITRFDDLLSIMSPERVEILKELYKCVDDIELLAGIWQEKPISGGHAPSTVYCIMVDQLRRYMASDRHWYERSDRPNAFTFAQLAEIRKMTVAKLLCYVGDSVSEIQPYAFLRAGPRNQMMNCDQLDKINFWAWLDPTCSYGSTYGKK